VAKVAIGAAIVSTALFLIATGTSWLFLARALSGFATGLAASASTAWLAELLPLERRSDASILATAGNFIGLAIGPLLGGVLAAYAPWPLRLPHAIYLTLLLATLAAVRTVPETVIGVQRRWSDLSLAPRFGVPQNIRLAFVSPAVTGFAIFSLIGFYGALIPGVIAENIDSGGPLVAGAVVFGFFAIATATLLVIRGCTPRATMMSGLILLPLSLGLLILVEHLHLLSLLGIATIFGGIAAAFGYRGSLQVVNVLAPPDRRGEVVSTYLIALFAGNSIPVVGIGLLATTTGPTVAHLAFAGIISIFAVIAATIGSRMSA
jgi:MFS family permease